MSSIIDFLTSRRSVSAILLGPPGPNSSQLSQIITAGIRVPDHGKLAPWRFILFDGERRRQAGARLLRLRLQRGERLSAEEEDAELNRFTRAPIVRSRITPSLWSSEAARDLDKPMDAKEFLAWNRSAPTSRRAEAATAMANAYLYSDVSEDVRRNLETCITVLLDDAAPTVRFALANALANNPDAPRHAILSLAADQTDIAAIVLRRSPVLTDGELVERVGAMSDPLQLAIAARPAISAGVAAALAELGSEAACLVLIGNNRADVAKSTFGQLAQRFGDDPEIRSALLDRDDLPIVVRQNLISVLSEALGNLVWIRDWLDRDRADLVAREARDQATVSIAAENGSEDLAALAEHLRVSEQLTTSLLLRTLCAGNLDFFATAMSVLARIPQRRIRGMVDERRLTAFSAVYGRAGLPERAFDAFAAAIKTCRHHAGEIVDPAMRCRFTRRVVEEVVARYEEISDDEINDLMTMLRRFAAEATRAAAREFVEIEIKAA